MTQNNAQKATGTLRNDQNRLIFKKGFSFSGYERDALFMNRDGKKFMDISGVSGIDSISDGRAAVFADFDNDGDEDVFLATIQGSGHLLFRNNIGQDNRWLRIILDGGKETGRDAYGSVVRVKTSAGTLTKVKAGGSGFLAQSDPRLLFGLAQDPAAQGIEVTWSNGRVENFSADARAGSTRATGSAASPVDPEMEPEVEVASVVADVVWLWDDPECLPVSRRQLLHVRLAKGDADLAERLEAVFAKHPGTDEVVLHVVVGSREVVVHADRYHVLAGPALSAEIDELVGAAATRLETVRPKAQANGNGHGRSRR